MLPKLKYWPFIIAFLAKRGILVNYCIAIATATTTPTSGTYLSSSSNWTKVGMLFFRRRPIQTPADVPERQEKNTVEVTITTLVWVVVDDTPSNRWLLP